MITGDDVMSKIQEVRHSLPGWMTRSPKFQIFNAIVVTNPVLMMDRFFRMQFAAKMLFHYIDMFEDLFAWVGVVRISHSNVAGLQWKLSFPSRVFWTYFGPAQLSGRLDLLFSPKTPASGSETTTQTRPNNILNNTAVASALPFNLSPFVGSGSFDNIETRESFSS